MGELFSYKKRNKETGELERVEVELSTEEIADILSKRTATTIFNDKLESVLNDPDLSKEDFGDIFTAYFRMRIYGEIPTFNDRFLRKVFELLASGDKYTDKTYIETTLRNRANGQDGGRPRGEAGSDQDDTDDP